MVDVFSDLSFRGNPVAVVLDGAGLDTDTLIAITRWFNLSETTFLFPPEHPEADYRVRIFTLDRELPFAGHPTLGSCHAWLSAGGRARSSERIVQECAAGLISVERVGGRLAFAAPSLIRSGEVDPLNRAELAAVLNVSPRDIVAAAWVDNGPGWVGVLLASAEAVLALEPVRHHRLSAFIGVIGPYPIGAPEAYEVRAFFTDHTGMLLEDPVTGSLNASLAQWVTGAGYASPPYTVSQGTRLGRSGRVYVSARGNQQILIGGNTRSLLTGALDV
jgi:PhzF family phenazine biosynthesis protein